MNLHCTTALVRKAALIGIEDLHVSGILKNHKLAQAVSDVSWAEARRQLEYKAPAAGSQVVAIDRFYPSSKTCNQCGYIHGARSKGSRMVLLGVQAVG